jgi:hypothetical protein
MGPNTLLADGTSTYKCGLFPLSWLLYVRINTLQLKKIRAAMYKRFSAHVTDWETFSRKRLLATEFL